MTIMATDNEANLNIVYPISLAWLNLQLQSNKYISSLYISVSIWAVRFLPSKCKDLPLEYTFLFDNYVQWALLM